MRKLPISEYQKRFLLDWEKRKDNTHNVSVIYKLKSGVDKEALEKACDFFIQRNEIVHAKFSEDGKECFYEKLKIEDVFREIVVEPEEVDKKIREVLDRPFDLSKGCLLNIYLLNIANTGEYVFIPSSVHHSIADGEYMNQLLRQISFAYNCVIKGKRFSIPEQSYSEATSQLNALLTKEYLCEAREFWKSFIGDIPASIKLPYKKGYQLDIYDRKGGFIYFFLGKSKKDKLREAAKKHNTTLFIALVALLGINVYKYSKQEKFVLSYPIDIRPAGFKKVVGCFVNNAVLKFDFNNISNFDDIVQDLNRQRKLTKKYNLYPYIDLIHDQVDKGAREDSIFNLNITQTNLNSDMLTLEDCEYRQLNVPWSERISNQMSFLYDENTPNDKLKFRFQYRTALFDEKTMKRFIRDYQKMLLELIHSIDEEDNFL